MIILDTNVVSAFMGPVIEIQIRHWLDRLPRNSIWTTSVNVFEIRYGIESLPDSRKRRKLEVAFEEAMRVDLGGRVLPFDVHAAEVSGRLSAERSRLGRPFEIRDSQIAGIAKVQNGSLATRNIKDFDLVGLDLIDPWSLQS